MSRKELEKLLKEVGGCNDEGFLRTIVIGKLPQLVIKGRLTPEEGLEAFREAASREEFLIRRGEEIPPLGRPDRTLGQLGGGWFCSLVNSFTSQGPLPYPAFPPKPPPSPIEEELKKL